MAIRVGRRVNTLHPQLADLQGFTVTHLPRPGLYGLSTNNLKIRHKVHQGLVAARVVKVVVSCQNGRDLDASRLSCLEADLSVCWVDGGR